MGAREEAKQIQRLKRNLDGAPIRTQAATREYREGWERIFGKIANAIDQGSVTVITPGMFKNRNLWLPPEGEVACRLPAYAVKITGISEQPNQRRRTARNGGKQP